MEKLILKFLTDSITSQELDILKKWLEKSKNQEVFKSYIRDAYNTNKLIEINPDIAFNNVLDAIAKKEKPVKKLYPYWTRYAAAIIVIGFLLTGYVFKDKFFTGSNLPKVEETVIAAGTTKATLILENGTTLALEKGKQHATAHFSTDGEELVYANSIANKKSEIAYNYLEVPRGGQFSIKLSDGTKVWLNSESKLKYPESFISGQAREVTLMYGEAYFEVTPSTENNNDHFVVVSSDQEIEVLGTKFNVNTYTSNLTKSTLVEGKIYLKANKVQHELMPGQQAVYNSNNKTIDIKAIDVYNEISWIHGVFSFKEKSFEDIMAVLSRWYDVDVKYLNNEVKQVKFTGTLSKNQSLENVLSVITRTTSMTYKIQEHVILVE